MPPISQVTVDLVIFTIREHRLEVLLIERALPGGLIRDGESLEQAALRVLEDQTGLRDVYLEQLYTFGDPGRDPRGGGRVVTVAYYALISADQAAARAARWWPVAKHPRLAFDHDRILDYAVERLRNKLEYTTVGFQLLPRRFTLTDLQRVYEAILGRPLDKRNFRRKLGLLGILKPVKDQRGKGVGRPAQLYEFSAREFTKLKDVGIIFPF